MKRALPSTVLIASLLGGCFEGDPGDVTLDRVEDDLIDAACLRAVRCRLAPDVDTCRASTAPSTWLQERLAAVRAGRATYHGDRMAACIAATRDGECTLSTAVETNRICVDVFQGAMEEGAMCFDATVCATGKCRLPSSCTTTCCAGICDSPDAKNVPIGESCFADGDCAGDASCSWQGICTPWPAEGDVCGGTIVCRSPLYCDLAMGICRRLPARGETCDSTSWFPCDRLDDGCDATTNTCVPLLDLGQPCVVTANGSTQQNCVAYAWCDGSTCQPRPAVGQPCADVPCLGGLSCYTTTNTCAFPPPTPICGA